MVTPPTAYRPRAWTAMRISVRRDSRAAGTPRLQRRMADAPHHRQTLQPSHHAAQQIGVVHPGLHHVRPHLPQRVPQCAQAPPREAPARHVECPHCDSRVREQRAVFPVAGQAHDMVLILRIVADEPIQHRLGAAVGQARDDVYYHHNLRAPAPANRLTALTNFAINICHELPEYKIIGIAHLALAKAYKTVRHNKIECELSDKFLRALNSSRNDKEYKRGIPVGRSKQYRI